MDFIFFKGVATLYTCMIIFGTMIFSNLIVVSMILLIKENVTFNPESSLLPTFLRTKLQAIFDANLLPEKDLDVLEREILFSKVK